MVSKDQFMSELGVFSEGKHYMATNPQKLLSVQEWGPVAAAHAFDAKSNIRRILRLM